MAARKSSGKKRSSYIEFDKARRKGTAPRFPKGESYYEDLVLGRLPKPSPPKKKK